MKERQRGDGTGLRHLSLASNPIGDIGIETLALGIQANPTLKRLVLSECKIGERGAAKLGQALENNSCLEHLSLSWNVLGERGGNYIAVGPTRAGKLFLTHGVKRRSISSSCL